MPDFQQHFKDTSHFRWWINYSNFSSFRWSISWLRPVLFNGRHGALLSPNSSKLYLFWSRQNEVKMADNPTMHLDTCLHNQMRFAQAFYTQRSRNTARKLLLLQIREFFKYQAAVALFRAINKSYFKKMCFQLIEN